MLRPGGQVLVIEIMPTARLAAIASLHAHHSEHQHGFDDAVTDAGFADVSVGRVTKRVIGFVTGRRPG